MADRKRPPSHRAQQAEAANRLREDAARRGLGCPTGAEYRAVRQAVSRWRRGVSPRRRLWLWLQYLWCRRRCVRLGEDPHMEVWAWGRRPS